MTPTKSTLVPVTPNRLTATLTPHSGKSITLPLPPNTPFGDFATYSEYTWTKEAKRTWGEHKTPLLKLSDIPKDAKLVTYTYHAPQHRRMADGDVRITTSDFERLEAASKATVSIWAVSKEYVAYVTCNTTHYGGWG